MIHKRDHTRHVFAKGPDCPRLVIYCRICVKFSVGISDVEFSDTLLMNLLHKIRHRKLCVRIVVSNVDRIQFPTVDDQPYYQK